MKTEQIRRSKIRAKRVQSTLQSINSVVGEISSDSKRLTLPSSSLSKSYCKTNVILYFPSLKTEVDVVTCSGPRVCRGSQRETVCLCLWKLVVRSMLEPVQEGPYKELGQEPVSFPFKEVDKKETYSILDREG